MIKRTVNQPENEIYIAESADVVGDVSIAKGASVWYQSAIRADHDSISIGEGTNIQDGCVLHTDAGFPLKIGANVTVGHNAIIHGCTIEDGSLIGMGSIVMNGAVIGKGCIIGAGALVTQGMVVPDGMMAFGSPAKVKRALTDNERAANLASAAEYARLAKVHFS